VAKRRVGRYPKEFRHKAIEPLKSCKRKWPLFSGLQIFVTRILLKIILISAQPACLSFIAHSTDVPRRKPFGPLTTKQGAAFRPPGRLMLHDNRQTGPEVPRSQQSGSCWTERTFAEHFGTGFSGPLKWRKCGAGKRNLTDSSDSIDPRAPEGTRATLSRIIA
jgi:hypothetical protein